MRIEPRRRRERQASNGPRMGGGCAPRPQPRASNVRVQMLPISQIKTNPRNSKTHPAKQISQIQNSIVAFGFTNPLLVTEEGALIAGEGRYKAAQRLAWRQCWSSSWRDYRRRNSVRLRLLITGLRRARAGTVSALRSKYQS